MIGLLLLQLGGQFDLFGFESGDLFFESMHQLLLVFSLLGARLPLLGLEPFLLLKLVAGPIAKIDFDGRRRCAGGACRQSLACRSRGALVQIILVITAIMHEPPCVHMDYVVGQRADEIDIVADKNERALELLQRCDQRIDARNVQVRCRLIHEKEVRRIEQELDQRQAAFLSTA